MAGVGIGKVCQHRVAFNTDPDWKSDNALQHIGKTPSERLSQQARPRLGTWQIEKDKTFTSLDERGLGKRERDLKVLGAIGERRDFHTGGRNESQPHQLRTLNCASDLHAKIEAAEGFDDGSPERTSVQVAGRGGRTWGGRCPLALDRSLGFAHKHLIEHGHDNSSKNVEQVAAGNVHFPEGR